jgi:hypothetical protein
VNGATLEIENYYLPIAAYAAAFREAGFRDVAVHRPELGPAGGGDDDRGHWGDLLDHPVAILIDCVKE